MWDEACYSLDLINMFTRKSFKQSIQRYNIAPSYSGQVYEVLAFVFAIVFYDDLLGKAL